MITFIIPVYNEEARIQRCLDSIASQDYPHDDIEILIPDGGSTDRTREIIKDWRRQHDIATTIVHNEEKITEFGTAKALKLMKGDFLVLFAGDNELTEPNWLSLALKTFKVFPDIFAFESCYLNIPGGSPVVNYLTATIHISDPLARDIAIQPKETDRRILDGQTFRKLLADPGYPAGANGFIYRRSAIEPYFGLHTFEEAYVIMDIAKKGAFIGCIDGHGVRHYYTDSLRHYLAKRSKIALKHSTRTQERETWVDHTGKRIFLFTFLHLTVVYPLLFSIYKAVQKRDVLWLMHAPMCFLTTTIYAWNWALIKITKRRAW